MLSLQYKEILKTQKKRDQGACFGATWQIIMVIYVTFGKIAVRNK